MKMTIVFITLPPSGEQGPRASSLNLPENNDCENDMEELQRMG
jgi:hypothetical protein